MTETLEALLDRWRERLSKYQRANYDSLERSYEIELEACIEELSAVVGASPPQPDLRELLVRADSYLSLLWHRHTSPDIKGDYLLARDVERTIGDLRSASREGD